MTRDQMRLVASLVLARVQGQITHTAEALGVRTAEERTEFLLALSGAVVACAGGACGIPNYRELAMQYADETESAIKANQSARRAQDESLS